MLFQAAENDETGRTAAEYTHPEWFEEESTFKEQMFREDNQGKGRSQSQQATVLAFEHRAN